MNKNSNHSPHIIRNLPAGVNKRLSSISAKEDIFQKALNQSGYDFNLKFATDAINEKKQKRNRGEK